MKGSWTTYFTTQYEAYHTRFQAARWLDQKTWLACANPSLSIANLSADDRFTYCAQRGSLPASALILMGAALYGFRHYRKHGRKPGESSLTLILFSLSVFNFLLVLGTDSNPERLEKTFLRYLFLSWIFLLAAIFNDSGLREKLCASRVFWILLGLFSAAGFSLQIVFGDFFLRTQWVS